LVHSEKKFLISDKFIQGRSCGGKNKIPSFYALVFFTIVMLFLFIACARGLQCADYDVNLVAFPACLAMLWFELCRQTPVLSKRVAAYFDQE